MEDLHNINNQSNSGFMKFILIIMLFITCALYIAWTTILYCTWHIIISFYVRVCGACTEWQWVDMGMVL
jgi:hypothetical protein